MPDNDDLVDAWRGLASRFRHRRDEAEDYLQDAVVAALDERRRTGNTPNAAAAWLRTVARRREVDHVRRAQCERRVAQSAYAEELDADVAHEVVDRHEASWLASHVEQLPATTRNVVRALAAGRTQGDVATELGLTPRAVEAHVRRARIALRRVLDRAGALVPFPLLRRRWRRLLPLGAAGVATAVGVAMMGTPDSAMLIPVPPKPYVHHDPDRPAPADGVAVGRSGFDIAPAAAPRLSRQARDVARNDDSDAPEPPGATSPPALPGPVETPGVVVVNPAGGEETTTFETIRGAWYDVTVAGTYSFNGRENLADCGHYMPEHTEGWERYASLYVDGTIAPCFWMAVDPLHVYTWRIKGTGQPVKFWIDDAGGKNDNVGRLAITMQRVETGS